MRHRSSCLLLSLLALAVISTGCSPKQESQQEKERVGPSAITAPADYVHAGFQAGEKAKATIGLIALNKAITQYRMQNGSNPSSLKQLHDEGFVPQIPPAPSGQKYSYDTRTGQVTLVAK